jgi:hypothetical protein
MDGSTSGSGGAGCSYPSATHTPKAYNLLNSTGGWVNGDGGYMASYLTVQNDQQLNSPPDGNYTFTYEGQVICSVFGDFYDVYLPGLLYHLTTTYGQNYGDTQRGAPPKNAYCDWQPACTSVPSTGTPTCGESGWESLHPILNTQFCKPFIKERFLSRDYPSIGGNPGYRVCYGVDFAATGPGPCT